MTNTIARIKTGGKNFEIIIDNIDKAVEFKKIGGDVSEFLAIDTIFTDSKKGDHAGEDDLKKAFGTIDFKEIAGKIIKQGEIQISQEFRDNQQDEKTKQIVNFLVKNAVDPRTNNPYTEDRIKTALKEASINIKNKPIESQISEIIRKLISVIPIKIETKKVIITIPAQYTGQAYGVLQTYKESEEWLGNGNLKVLVNIPAGLQMDFYDKLNAITHGAVLSEEVKEKK